MEMSLRCCSILLLEANGHESLAKSLCVLHLPGEQQVVEGSMTTARFSDASSTHPSSTAMVAVLHPNAAQQSRTTLWDVPEDGPRNTSTCLGFDCGLVPPLPLSVGPKPGRWRGTWHGSLLGWTARSYSVKHSRAQSCTALGLTLSALRSQHLHMLLVLGTAPTLSDF